MPAPASCRLMILVLVAAGIAVPARSVASPPYTTLIHPPPGTLLNEGDNVRLEANAFDVDGTVLKVEFYLDDALLGEAAPGPFRVWWTNAALGAHTLLSVAVDDTLLRATSHVATVMVEPPVARMLTWQPPTSPGGEWNTATANWRFNGRPTLFHAGDSVAWYYGSSNFIGLDGAPVPVSPSATVLQGQTWFAGGDILTGSVDVYGSGWSVFSNYSGSLSFAGGTLLRPSTSGGLTYDVSAAPNGASLHFGTGPIVNGALFSFQPASNRVATLENDFVVTNFSAFISASLRPGAVSRFSGRLTLGTLLQFQLQTAAYNAPLVDAIDWSGPIVLEQPRSPSPGQGPKISILGNYSPRNVVLSGNISDAPGTNTEKLRLQGYAVTAIRLTGTNTYTRGTVIEYSPSGPSTVVEVAPQSSLGEGNLEVQGGGVLRLRGSGNLRPGARAIVQGRVILDPGVKIRLSSLTLGPSNFTIGRFTGTNSPGSFYAPFLASNGTFRLPATNLPPAVTLDLPVAGENYTPGSNLILRAAVTDLDSDIARVEFRMNGALLGVRTNVPYQFTLREVPAGAYTFQASAIDDDGGSAVSDVVAVTVLPRIKQIEYGSDAVGIDFDAIVNHPVTLQGTDRWAPAGWTNLHSVPPATSPMPVRFLDFHETNRSERFYRLRIP